MFGFSKNIWNEYQECGLVPGIAKPMCIPVRKNEKNTYKFNHRTAKVPVSMMDAYGIRENGSFVPGGLANENRRRRKAYLNNIPNAMHENNANVNTNVNTNVTPRFSGVPSLPPPSPQSMRENINPIVYKNAQKQQERATRTGRVSRPPLREIIRSRNRKTRRANKKTRKARKA